MEKGELEAGGRDTVLTARDPHGVLQHIHSVSF